MKKLIVITWAMFSTTIAYSSNISPAKTKHHPLYLWTQLIGANSYSARVIMPLKQKCPSIIIDKKSLPMSVRAQPTHDFPILVCEALFSGDVSEATVGPYQLKIPTLINRVTVIGESFANKNSKNFFSTVTEDINTTLPDSQLLIHSGNYVEPISNKNSWTIWEEQFFKPSKEILSRTLLLANRGNKESCTSHGAGSKGWNLFLSPAPYYQKCTGGAHSFYAYSGGFSAVVLDSTSETPAEQNSEKPSFNTQKNTLKKITKDYGSLLSEAHSTWLITHRPLWMTFTTETDDHIKSPDGTYNWRKSIRAWVKKNIHLVIAGGYRLASMTQMAGYPPQYTAGNSNFMIPASELHTPKSIDKVKIVKKYLISEVGFSQFYRKDPQEKYWKTEWHIVN